MTPGRRDTLESTTPFTRTGNQTDSDTNWMALLTVARIVDSSVSADPNGCRLGSARVAGGRAGTTQLRYSTACPEPP